MKIKVLALAITLLLLPAAASADKLKGGLPGCMTAELLDQLMQAIVDNDQKTGEDLLHAGCIITAGGVEVKVLDRSVKGKVRVEITKGDQSLQMWTVTQNVLP